MSDKDQPPIEESDGSSEPESSESETELMITTRERRRTAGNRYSQVVTQERIDEDEEDDVALLFAEAEGEDEEYNSDGADDEADMSSSDDDDQGPNAVPEDVEGEQEMQRQAKLERQKKRKADMAMTTISAIRKKPKIDPTSLHRAADRPNPSKRKERVSWLPDESSAPGRISLRKQTVAHRENLIERLKENEEVRLKNKAQREKKEKLKAAEAPKEMTQADRLAEAEKNERRNAKSLNRWELMEKHRAEEQAARLAALKDRKLDGPVITLYSSAYTYQGLKTDRASPGPNTADGPIPKKRGPKPKKLEAQSGSSTPVTAGSFVQSPFTQIVANKINNLSTSKSPGPTAGASTTGASTTDALPTDALPTDALPTDALPTDALPTDALPTDALPTDALPTDALPTDALPIDAPPIGAPLIDASTTAVSSVKTPDTTTPAVDHPDMATPILTVSQTSDCGEQSELQKSGSIPSDPGQAIPAKVESTAIELDQKLAEPENIFESRDLPIQTDQVHTDEKAVEHVRQPERPQQEAGLNLVSRLAERESKELPLVQMEPDHVIESSTISATLGAQAKEQSPSNPPTHPQTQPNDINQETATSNPSIPSILPVQQPPLVEVVSTRNLVVLERFEELSAQAKQAYQVFYSTKKNAKPVKQTTELCAISGQSARYKDPLSGVAYANVGAYKRLEGLQEYGYIWSGMLGCYVGRTDHVARGVPEGFLDK